MSTPDDSDAAFPAVYTRWNHDFDAREVSSEGGMSQRRYLAAKAMQGYVAALAPQTQADRERVAALSVFMADELLKALK